ncbi:MAG: hypothetical protein ABL997_11865, partial [Planctomycetota bacterium]
MPPSVRKPAALVALLLATACSAPPPARDESKDLDLDLATFAAFDAAQFPGAASVLSGFAPIDPSPEFRVGDALLFGLTIDDGEQRTCRMLRLEVASLMPGEIRIDAANRTMVVVRSKATMSFTGTRKVQADGREVEEPVARQMSTTPLRLRLGLYDADGTKLSESTAVLFEELLTSGLLPLSQSEVDFDSSVGSTGLLFTLQQLGKDDTTLHSLLFSVVDVPSVLSVMLHLGVSVVISSEFGSEGPTLLVGERTEPTRVLPVNIEVNGDCALMARIVCCESQLPYAVG